MKKFCILAVIMTVVALAVTGCSTHESELAKENREAEEKLEEYMETMETGGKADKVPDPNAEEMVIIALYSVADGDTGLKKNMEAVPEVDDWELTQKLIEYKVLPETAEVVNYEPEAHELEYDGCPDGITARQAIAIINTYVENAELEGQLKLIINGEEVMTSGYESAYEDVDDTYAGGADDADLSQGGPGME